jgi:hypothetical protein
MQVIDTRELDEKADSLSNSEIYWTYCALDCCVTYDVLNAIEPQLDEVSRATYNSSLALVPVTLEMMLRGFLVDVARQQEVLKQYEKQLAELEAKWVRLCSEGLGIPADRTKRDKNRSAVPINISSPKDVQYLFHTVLQIPQKKKRKKGQTEATVTTDREVLESFRSYYYAEIFVNFILAMRDCAKAIGFLRTKLDADSRIRCSFNVAGTTTGRLSSSFSDLGTGTNLQNISGRMKDIFVPDHGYALVDIDLEQGDSRGVGAIAWNWFVESHGEAWAGSYLDACESGDLHTTVTRMAWTHLDWPANLDPKLCKKVAEQIAYRDLSYRDLSKKLGHGCLTSDHQVLTRSGWVPIAEQPSEIMQWSEHGSCFAQVSNWIAKPYSGELQIFEGNSISACMTHDHRVPYKADQRSPGIKVRPASAGPQCNMPLGHGWIGGDEIVPAKLIAAFMCDGHQEINWMSFHLHKERKKERLIKLCEEYGYEYKIHGDKIRVRGYLPKEPGAFQLNWTASCLRDFITELRHWDGHIGKTSVSLFSAKVEHLEWYQTFGRILGIGGAIQKPQTSGFGTMMWKLQQNNRLWASGASVTHLKRDAQNVMVYCPTVPSGFFYVRRGGKIFVTGNSNYLGQPNTMAQHAHLPVSTIVDFQRNYFRAFECIAEWQKETIRQLKETRQLITPFGRRRYFWDDPNAVPTQNAAIAYSPQSTTGEFINRGAIQLQHYRNTHNLPIGFVLQVHDSLVLILKQERLEELVPLVLDKLRVVLRLAKGREFTIPLGVKVGWNYGKTEFNRDGSVKSNPFGLQPWKGKEERRPPRALTTIQALLNSPLTQRY